MTERFDFRNLVRNTYKDLTLPRLKGRIDALRRYQVEGDVLETLIKM